jgi:hypothetical protein
MADLNERSAMSRAAKAQALLNDEELTAAFESVRAAIIDRWEAAPIRDRDGAHELKLQLKLLADVRANLQAVVNTGKVIQHRISMLERAKRGIKQWT